VFPNEMKLAHVLTPPEEAWPRSWITEQLPPYIFAFIYF
jgi:hypothetical protein